MKINMKKTIKIVGIISIVAIALNIIISIIYNKYYLNGNNEDNIRRSIMNLQKNHMSDTESLSIIKKITLEDDLYVIYKNKFNCGIAEFSKNTWDDYKINFIESGNLDEVNFHLTMEANQINQYFIVYGDGRNLEFNRVEVGINNNFVPVVIPKDIFSDVININQFANGSDYKYDYRYYDEDGNLIEGQIVEIKDN